MSKPRWPKYVPVLTAGECERSLWIWLFDTFTDAGAHSTAKRILKCETDYMPVICLTLDECAAAWNRMRKRLGYVVEVPR